MKRNSRSVFIAVAILAVLSLLVSACASTPEPTAVPPTEVMEEIEEPLEEMAEGLRSYAMRLHPGVQSHPR